MRWMNRSWGCSRQSCTETPPPSPPTAGPGRDLTTSRSSTTASADTRRLACLHRSSSKLDLDQRQRHKSNVLTPPNSVQARASIKSRPVQFVRCLNDQPYIHFDFLPICYRFMGGRTSVEQSAPS